ncbi:HtaA domain-containing protein, partial [Microterricola pindariensis]
LTIGGDASGAIELKPDGSFEATVTVTEEFAKNPGTGNYGIYTYSGSGASAAQFETFTPITFAPKVVAPTIATSVTSAAAESGLAVRVVGSQFGLTTGAYAALIEKGTEASVDASGGYAAFGFWMTPGAIVGGAFDKSLVAPAAVLDRSKQYEVIVWEGHTAPNTDTIYARADVTPTAGQWDTLFPAPQPGAEATTTTLSVDKTAVVEGATVTATAVIAPVAASGTVSFLNGSTVVAKDVAVTGGTATASLKLATIGTASLTAVFTPAKNALFLTSTSTAVSVAVAAKPVTPPAAQTGELSWGVYGAFRDYITGPIAGGEVALSDGVTAAGTGFLFAQAGGTVDLAAGKGSANYSGTLRFTGHHGALDVTMSAPTLRLDSAASATLSVAVNGKRVDFATVNLAAAGTSTEKGKTLFVDAPVTLSAAGAVAFQGFYPAGTLIDPITVAFSTGATEPVETVGTRTALSVDKDTLVVGGSVKLSATVTPASAQGSVIFAANGNQLGTAVRVADGQASADAVLRTVGSIALTARFVPDAGFGASSSAASTVKVTSSVLPPVKPPVITPPTTPVVPPVVAPTVQGGSLSWGLGSVFRNYITGPIAKGSISVGSGATSSGGVFQFGQSGGSFDQGSGTGTADYAGSVRFTGHGGILDLTFASPTLSVTSATSALLSLSVNGGRVDFATVNLGAAARSSLNGATVFSGAPVTLTAAGASSFQGYYSAGEVLDPMTVTIGAAAAAPSGNTGTIATASVNTPAQSAVPASPPATTGITLTPEVLGSIAAGGQISFEVDGFQPNETGIRIVIYSTPTVMAENLTADANGVVRWSGTLPATLTGEHTLTVQGSISKGVVITIPERTVAGFCPVEGATLDWGFKQSFLAYISSGIANGGWELAGGTTEADGLFHWADGTGSIDQKSGAGLVSYLGSIRFTGHDGALDTTVANPRIELVSETEGYLVLDVTGTTQQGEPINGQALRFGQLTLGAGSLAVTETGITGTDIEAVLTDAGAAAFGTYPAGDALDPISFTLPTADCAVVAAEAESSEAGPSDKTVTAISADVAEQGVSWIVWVLAAVLAAALAVIVVLLAKRRRAGADASAE